MGPKRLADVECQDPGSDQGVTSFATSAKLAMTFMLPLCLTESSQNAY